MSLENLPNEIINLALFLPLTDISRLCQTSSRYNNIICRSEHFWKLKFIIDNGNTIGLEVGKNFIKIGITFGYLL